MAQLGRDPEPVVLRTNETLRGEQLIYQCEDSHIEATIGILIVANQWPASWRDPTAGFFVDLSADTTDLRDTRIPRPRVIGSVPVNTEQLDTAIERSHLHTSVAPLYHWE